MSFATDPGEGAGNHERMYGERFCITDRPAAKALHPERPFPLATLCGLSEEDSNAPQASLLVCCCKHRSCSSCVAAFCCRRTEASFYIRRHDGAEAHRRSASLA